MGTYSARVETIRLVLNERHAESVRPHKRKFKVPTHAKHFKGGQATIARVGSNRVFDMYFKPFKIGGTE